MAKILITGGSGFIGKKIAENCIKMGHEVRVFDLIPSLDPNVKESLTGTILDPYEISNAARGCDYIVHAAAALGVQRTETKRLECLFINIQGTINILEAAVKERIKKVLLTSSSEVYGDAQVDTYDELAPLNPKSNYAITKLVGEEYLRAYRQTYGLDYSIVRFFSIYGREQSPHFVVPMFAEAIKNEQAPTIYGDGKQIRSFCHVDDASRGAVMALLSENTSEQIFNIGNDKSPISIAELAEKMIAISGKKMKPKHVSFDESDRDERREIYRRIPSCKKAAKYFGYEPKIDLLEGLKSMFV